MSFYPSYKEQWGKLSFKHKKALEDIPHLQDIDGWLLLVEAAELFLLSKQISPTRPIICEIGTWKGKSAYVFSSALRGTCGILYSVDPFNGDGDSISKDCYQEQIKELNVSLLQNFEDTMKRYGLWEYVRVIPFLSVEAKSRFHEKKIDLLFIDGNHDYGAVREDYLLWSDLISSGGIIVLHDVDATHVDGPKRVSEEFILGNPGWKDVHIVGEMIIATKV